MVFGVIPSAHGTTAIVPFLGDGGGDAYHHARSGGNRDDVTADSRGRGFV